MAKTRVAIMGVGDEATEAGRLAEAVDVIRRALPETGFLEVDFQVVSDQQALIRAKLRVWADNDSADLILTFGGVGMGTKGRTPEATAEVLERRLPGIAELIRAASLQADPAVALLRLEAGVRRRTLIINLPGEAERLEQSLPVLMSVVPAAMQELRAVDPLQTMW